MSVLVKVQGSDSIGVASALQGPFYTLSPSVGSRMIQNERVLNSSSKRVLGLIREASRDVDVDHLPIFGSSRITCPYYDDLRRLTHHPTADAGPYLS